MTVCNMSIEGGARVGYINPDEKTFEYLKRKAIFTDWIRLGEGCRELEVLR